MPIGGNGPTGLNSNTIPAPVVPRMRPFNSSYMPTTMLPGFYVTSDADISARDVPADGSVAFFPLKDLTHIVAKRWDGNTLESAVYAIQPQQQTQQQTQQPPLPPPPPPIQQQAQPEANSQPSEQPAQTNEAILSAFNKMNEGIANAFAQFGGVLAAMQQNLDQLNSRFGDDGGMG